MCSEGHVLKVGHQNNNPFIMGSDTPRQDVIDESHDTGEQKRVQTLKSRHLKFHGDKHDEDDNNNPQGRLDGP